MKHYFIKSKGKELDVGQMDLDNGLFTKVVRFSIHYWKGGAEYVKGRGGWAIAVKTLDELADNGCKKIIIEEREYGVKFIVDFAFFQKHSWEIPSNKSPEPQKVLNLDWWPVYDASGKMIKPGRKEETKLEYVSLPPVVSVKQLKLF